MTGQIIKQILTHIKETNNDKTINQILSNRIKLNKRAAMAPLIFCPFSIQANFEIFGTNYVW